MLLPRFRIRTMMIAVVAVAIMLAASAEALDRLMNPAPIDYYACLSNGYPRVDALLNQIEWNHQHPSDGAHPCDSPE